MFTLLVEMSTYCLNEGSTAVEVTNSKHWGLRISSTPCMILAMLATSLAAALMLVLGGIQTHLTTTVGNSLGK